MKRLLATAAALLVASTALADIGPPPGFTRVPVEYKITTDKEFADYSFYTVNLLGDPAKELKIDPKSPGVIKPSAAGARSGERLVAVPKDAAKNFATEKDFLASVAKDKVPGAAWAKDTFYGRKEVKEAGAPKVIVVEHKIEKIDAKAGIVFSKEKADPRVPPPPPGCDTDDEVAAPSAYVPKSGTWVAGLAGTLAVVFGGLWVVRRGRRELA